MPGTVNVLLLQPLPYYGRWRLYQGTWRCRVQRLATGSCVRGDTPADSQMMAALLAEYGWDPDSVGSFLQALAQALRGIPLPAGSPEQLRASIQEHMDAIGEMRVFLLKTRPQLLQLPLPNGQCLAWSWSVYAVANVVLCDDQRQVLAALRTGRSRQIALVTSAGLLADPDLPWRTAADAQLPDTTLPLRLNVWVLERFYERLSAFYQRADGAAIRNRLRREASA